MRAILPILACLLILGELSQASESIRFFYSANRQGEIEPCGCQTGQIGGLVRLYSFLKKERDPAQPSLFVNSGDSFFSSAQLSPYRLKREKRTAQLIAKSYREFGMDVMTPGESDFAAGLNYLRELKKETGAVFVSSNLLGKGGKPLFRESFVWKKSGVKIGFLSLASPEAFQEVKGVKVEDPEAVLKRVVKKLRSAKVDRIVLLSHLGLEWDRKISDLRQVDLIFGAHSMDVVATRTKNGSSIFQPGIEGQQIGVFDYYWKNPLLSRNRLVPLEAHYDGENVIRKMVSTYNEESRKVAMAASAPKAKKSKKAFVAHPRHCRSCHTEQYEFWKSTHHASAYLVLYAKNQNFDPECIHCHSLAFKEEGGFQKIARPFVLSGKTPKHPFVDTLMQQVFKKDKQKALDSRTEPKRYAKLKKIYHEKIEALESEGKIKQIFIDVQCEHCHGNRSGHPNPSVSTIKKVKKEACTSCHRPPNDPNFNFEKQVKRVACPLIPREGKLAN